MSARARWFMDDLPPAPPDFEQPVQEVGTPVNVRDPDPLWGLLEELARAEGRYDGMGVTCEWKDAHHYGGAEGSCQDCPLRAANPKPLAHLCAIGVEQERAVRAIRGSG